MRRNSNHGLFAFAGSRDFFVEVIFECHETMIVRTVEDACPYNISLR